MQGIRLWRGCLSVCPLSDSHTSSVGTLETVSESVCIGRNRCATYTNQVITIRNHICKLAGCGARGPALVGWTLECQLFETTYLALQVSYYM